MRTLIDRVFSNGLSHAPQPEAIHHVGVANMFNAVTMVFCLSLALFDWMQGYGGMALLLCGIAALALFSMLHLGRTGKRSNINPLLALALIGVDWWLMATGGVAGMGHLWVFSLPPLLLFTFGLRRGGMLVALLVFGIICILYGPEELSPFEYGDSFAPRYLLALTASISLVSVAEAARRHSERRLLALTHQLAFCARSDPLTGLANRRSLCERFEQERQRSLRNNTPLSLILCDIDHFKAINDTHGHECGDYVLRKLADMLRTNMRAQDTVCRWGGEEFLLLLPDTDEKGATRLAEKLRTLTESYPFSYHGIPIRVTLCFGVHQCSREGHTDYHIRKADRKLYMAKEQGRNRVVSGDIPDILLPPGYIEEAD